MYKIKNLVTRLLTGLAMMFLGVATGIAQAAGTTTATAPDLSGLTNMVDFSTVITAVLAIAALLAGVYVAIKGAKTVLHMIKGN